MEFNKIAIIIPALNEETTLASVITSVSQFGTVIVVDDGSIDATVDVAKACGAITVSHQTNKGYENALNTGFKKANTLGMEAIITVDADGQHKSECVEKFASALKEEFQLVLGIRPKTQRMSEQIFQFVASNLWGWYDPLCGLKGYSIDIYRNAGFFDRYQSAGTELAYFGIKNGYRLKQIEISIEDRLDAPRFASTFSANWRILKTLVRLLLYSKKISEKNCLQN